MPAAGEKWSKEEIDDIIGIYFAMLAKEVSGQSYNKAEYKQKLSSLLPARSSKSIDFKCCNISAVLSRLNHPFISGFSPMPHYQKDLESAVKAYVESVEAFTGAGRLGPTAGAGTIRSGEALRIRWTEKGIRNWTDLFPPGEFDREGEFKNRTHLVEGPKGEKVYAHYDLLVKGAVAILNYEKSQYRAANIKSGLCIGRMFINFSDGDRVKIAEILWQDEGDSSPKKAEVLWTRFKPGKIPDYDPPDPGAVAKRKIQTIKERPGQQEFRRKLRRAYGDTCVLAGCEVAEALDAAHIDPVINTLSDNPQNGLLLRKDLHALFDQQLLGIDPVTRRANFSKLLKNRAGYSDLHLKAQLRPPIAGYESYAPNLSALERRWQYFLKLEKDRTTSET